ncbi:transcription-repair coupling factor (superfamily II helicase) [Spirosoma oryzae]|uniref:Transcription-repair-coupling factor n=1 Tax=Spirosoma oryzae TaxID=1469603 RepID=A0A2T0SGH1_9BACT|nr:transcription-repair coupling factor [Spirosoma oryzae]PRY32511.1 transcription-repair coupling factor (superfamily II helicase) [Spirosoma oryzae]
MKPAELVGLYANDSFIQILSEPFGRKHTGDPQRLQIKGLAGSLDAVFASAIVKSVGGNHLFVMTDRDEAAYFYNDLQHLLEREILLFPMSYKKPYQYEEVENANVLMRAEVLNKLNPAPKDGLLVVTYPEALSEKVINKRSLQANTLTIRVGEKIDTNFVADLLLTYEFEKTDFVYEAGQFSVRGGIIDVFSFASEYPFRIDLFGDEVESIRQFNPETQLSTDPVDFINVIPNIQTKLIEETRDPFFSFLPATTTIWAKDVEFTLEIIEKCYEKAEQSFETVLASSGGIQVVSNPGDLFETRRTFLNQIKEFRTVEFGRKFYFKTDGRQQYQSKPQPSFNKDFKRLVDTLGDNQAKGYTNVIAAESFKQLDRLRTIFEELDPHLTFQPLNIGLREGYIDDSLKIVCFTDHQLFDRYYRFKVQDKFTKSKALTLRELKTLQPGDYVTHIDHGIGRFAGLEKVDNAGNQQEAIRLIYRDNDILLVSIHSLHKIAKYTGREGSPPPMSKLGSQEWEQKKSRIRKQVKDIARELIALYAKRRNAPGYAFSRDTFLQTELESSFLYEDTPDQAKATNDVKDDMERPNPMDRLVCGDVGFGKTEIAIRAAFKAVSDNKQVAVLVPTTILAMQHFKTFSDRMADFPVKVEYINRFRTAAQIKEILKGVASGEINILIGTHRIVNKDIKFKDLGLLIIDEEQKFGVKTKDRLKELRVEVDVLTLTATPIPRTLHFSLMGARDLSVIATPPPNRQPVTTEVHAFSETVIRDAISTEIKRGGQAFFVHNRIGDIESIGNMIMRLVPEARVGVAHGQMEGERLERMMTRFIDGEYDVLISTNIIESGLDIPNANTILINNAHYFGLSDLHQMRGRVGRSNRKAFCYLLTPPPSVLTADARKRLQTLEDFSDLGEGFKIAMRDLDIRGAGNLLGAEQSGFVNDLGFEMYHKVLDEAVQELRENEFKDLFETKPGDLKLKLPDTVIETDLPVVIPERYVHNISERLALYTRLDSIENSTELEAFRQEILDRFGPIPEEVINLIDMVNVRWKAERLYLEKLTLKNTILKGYFVSNGNDAFFTSDQFGKVIEYIKRNPSKCSLKESKGRPIFTHSGIDSVEQLNNVLAEMTS